MVQRYALKSKEPAFSSLADGNLFKANRWAAAEAKGSMPVKDDLWR